MRQTSEYRIVEDTYFNRPVFYAERRKRVPYLIFFSKWGRWLPFTGTSAADLESARKKLKDKLTPKKREETKIYHDPQLSD